MALTAAQLTEKITALQKALYSGESSIRFADREIRYRSVGEIQTALADAQRELASLSKPKTRVYRAMSRKGFD